MKHLISLIFIIACVSGFAQSLVSVDDRAELIDSETATMLNERLSPYGLLYVETVNYSKKCSYKYVTLFAKDQELWATLSNCDNEVLAQEKIDANYNELSKADLAFVLSRFIKENFENKVLETVVAEKPKENVLDNEVLEKEAKEEVAMEAENEKTIGGLVNQHSSRYFFGPSSIGLRKGEAYYQTTAFVLHDIQYGVSNRISLGLGSFIIPYFFYITPKYNVELSKNLTASIGSINTFIPTGHVASIFYGTLTKGSPNSNVTFGGGVATSFGYTSAVFNVSGILQVSPYIYLMTENYITPSSEIGGIFGLTGFRFVDKKVDVQSWNFGFFYFTAPYIGQLVIPMLSYNKKFGKKY